MRNLSFLMVLFFALSTRVYGQNGYDPHLKYAVTKLDGTVYIGNILNDDGREILMSTENLGNIYIPKSQIRSIKPVDEKDVKRGVYVGENIFTTRYQFTTNSFPIKKGDNYAVLNLYGPEVHFSVANNFSVGVMSTWIASPIALALKYTIPTSNDNLNFGVGTLLGSSGYLNQAKGYGGLHWGMATYGDRFNNVTASVGYGYFNIGDGGSDRMIPTGTYNAIQDEWGNSYMKLPDNVAYGSGTSTAPIFGLSGMFAVGERTTFIVDIMGVLGEQKRYYQTATYDGQSIYSSTVVTISEPVEYRSTSQNLIVMPALRFQRKDTRAVQVSLAGIIGRSSVRESSVFHPNPGQLNKNSYSFPVPQVSWFFKL